MIKKIKFKTNKPNLNTVVLTAVFTAMICALTIFPKINIPTGYIHLGDSMIYLAACFLPFPYSIFAASIGGGLADLFSGYAIWILPTMIIKALISIPFSSKPDKILTKRNLLMPILCGIISIIGYFYAGWLLFGTPASIVKDLICGLIQSAGGAILFIIAGNILDKVNFKKIIEMRGKL